MYVGKGEKGRGGRSLPESLIRDSKLEQHSHTFKTHRGGNPPLKADGIDGQASGELPGPDKQVLQM